MSAGPPSQLITHALDEPKQTKQKNASRIATRVVTPTHNNRNKNNNTITTMGAKGRRKKPEVKENTRKRIERIQESKKKQKFSTSADGKSENNNTGNGYGVIEAIPILASYRREKTSVSEERDLLVAMAYCNEMKMVSLVDDNASGTQTKLVSVFGGGESKEGEEKTPSSSSSFFKAEDTIRAMAFSKCGEYFAVSGDDKKVFIFERKKSEDKEGDFYYSLANTRLANKKVTSVTFTLDSKHIVYSDKYGDVRVSEVIGASSDSDDKDTTITKNDKNDAEGGDAETGVFDKLLLGHTGTVVTSVCIVDGVTKDDKKEEFVCTADQEGKIRVTRMPPANLRTDIEGSGFDIQSFCFGHSGFVAKVVPAFSKNVIVSAGGDGTIRAWDCLTGKQISKTLKCTPESPVQDLDVMPSGDENSIVVSAVLENGKKFGALMFVNELAAKQDEIHNQDETTDVNVGATRASVCALVENSTEEEEGIEKKYVKCLGRVGGEDVMEIKVSEEKIQKGIKASEFFNTTY
jgi:hypothetical protein